MDGQTDKAKTIELCQHSLAGPKEQASIYEHNKTFINCLSSSDLGIFCINTFHEWLDQNMHLNNTVYSRYLEFQGTEQNVSSYQ